MRISIHESKSLADIVTALIAKLDPDTPVTDDSGVSKTVSDQLETLFNIATDDVTPDVSYPDDLWLLALAVRKDPTLYEIACLPWTHAIVQDLEGTIVLIF